MTVLGEKSRVGKECEGKVSSRASTLDSEGRPFDVSKIEALRTTGYKKIRHLSAGSKLSSYYYIGTELRVCADCVRKPSSRPLLRDIIDRKTGEPKILKIISKSRIPPGVDSLNNWRALCEKLLNMPHIPNLMRVDQIWESETSFYIVTEKFIGGELFEYLLKEKAIPEDICKYIFRQILQAVDALHSMNLLHRDIKPENIMFRNPTKSVLPVSERYELALIDFDTCKMTDGNSSHIEVVNGKRRLVGTYGYLAPEILRGEEYSTASDLWSVGIILYILMTGIPPISMDKMYDAAASHAILTTAEANGINFNNPPLIEFPLARDLCKRLLSFDKNRRISSAADALAHPWLAGLPNIFDCSLRLRGHGGQHKHCPKDGGNNDNRNLDKSGNSGSGDNKAPEADSNKNKKGQVDNLEANKAQSEGTRLLPGECSRIPIPKYILMSTECTPISNKDLDLTTECSPLTESEDLDTSVDNSPSSLTNTPEDFTRNKNIGSYFPSGPIFWDKQKSEGTIKIIEGSKNELPARADKTSLKKRRPEVYDNEEFKTISRTKETLIQSLTTNAESIEGIFRRTLRRRIDIEG